MAARVHGAGGGGVQTLTVTADADAAELVAGVDISRDRGIASVVVVNRGNVDLTVQPDPAAAAPVALADDLYVLLPGELRELIVPRQAGAVPNSVAVRSISASPCPWSVEVGEQR